MKVLIIRLSSMGDVIHTLPALRALRSTFPDATIGWVVEDSHAGILMGLPELDRLYVVSRQRMKGGWRSRLQLARDMRTHMRSVHWDVAVDFQGLWKSYLVARWSGASRILGYAPSHEWTHWLYTDRVRLVTMDRHAVDRNLDLVATLGASVRYAGSREQLRRDFSYPISPADRAKASELIAELVADEAAPLVLLNFSARKPANRWGTKRFAELAQSLRASGMVPILTGALSDGGGAEEIQSLCREPVPSLVGRCSLSQLAAVMEKVDVLVTGDTGPMHIAVAVGLPVVALFGPANPVRTGPYSPDAVVLQKPRDCQPCYARFCKLGLDPAPCLLDIEVGEVLEHVQRVLGKEQGSQTTIEAKVTADPVGASSHTS